MYICRICYSLYIYIDMYIKYAYTCIHARVHKHNLGIDNMDMLAAPACGMLSLRSHLGLGCMLSKRSPKLATFVGAGPEILSAMGLTRALLPVLETPNKVEDRIV